MNRSTGFLCYLVSALLLGTFGLFIRRLEHDLSLLGQLSLRGLGSSLIVVPWFLITSGPEVKRQLLSPKVWGFGLLLPVGVAIWTLAVVLGSVRSSVFGLYLGALISSSVLSRMIFGESFTKLRAAAVGSALLGAAVYSIPFSGDPTSVALGALAGLFQSLLLAYRRMLTGFDRTAIVSAQTTGSFFVPAGLFVLQHGLPNAMPPAAVLVVALGYGAVVIAVSNLLLVAAPNLELSTGNVILSTELVWSVVFAAALLSEIPTGSEVLGCIVLLGALAAGALATKEAETA